MQIGDNTLTVADTPDALLGLSGAVNALATGLTLSGNATATTTQATELEALANTHRFSTDGYALTVTGSASALLGLSAATQQLATTLALSESGDTVNVANLTLLTDLGGKFSLAGNTLIVSDTASQLATLNGLEIARVNAKVLGTSATIDATTADQLAALPNLTLGNGVTLTVQGSYAELAALPGSITSIATLELTASTVPLTAAEASALAELTNFAPSAGVVVQDTIFNLNTVANADWPRAATGGYIVTDSVSNLLANASTQLLANANSVTLLGDAQVDATDFATLAGIAHFSRGTAALTVVDGPVAIADNATEIGLLASSALIDAAAPVTADQAEALAALNAAHMLSFTGGVSLSVQDSFSQLTLAGNAAGVALASTITVTGTGAQLAAATLHSWGTPQVYYELNAGGAITGPNATALHDLGAHYLPDGFTLTVADNAAGIANNAVAIEALGIGAQVTDSGAGVNAETAALIAMGSTLLSIALTDVSAVTALHAAELAPLAAKLATAAVAVADNAADVDTVLAGLETLGTHLSAVTVTDSAAQVGAYATDLATLASGTTLSIVLTDATTETPVGADTAAALVPVAASLAAAAVNVSDTGLDIAADATALAELGTALGTVTLSDGDTVAAATAAAIAPIDAHLGTDVTLNVADTATHIDGHLAGLDTLQTDLRLGSVTAAGETAADVVLYGTMLAGLGGTATIDDSAAAVSAHLDALEPFCGGGGVVTQITLNDGGTPDIGLSLAQVTTDAAVLGRIAGSFAYAITDTAGDLAADLGDGGASKILTLGAKLDSIAVSDESDTLTLTAATLFATGVDDGAGSALTKLVPDTLLAVTGMSIADFASLAGLTVAPGSFAVADTNSAIQGDLEDNLESSVLLAYRSHITAIATSGAITLDYATATAAHVNDGAGSVFALMTGETLDVTAVPVAAIAAVLTTGVAPASIAVTGTAGAIATDLETASPALVQYAAKIGAIADTSGTAVTLDADHALAAGVADSAASVFAKLTGGGLAVTGATVDQLDSLHGLYVIPASVAVSDDAGLIAADLELGASSRLETYAGGMLSAIASDDGIISLDDSYVAAVTAALALLPADSLDVTDVPVENIAAVAGLAGFAGMTVSDSAGDIRTDLLLGAASELAQHHLGITGVTFSSGGPISLTDAQAQTVVSAALAHLPAAGIDVTGVAVADIATITGFGAVLDSMTVSDAAAAITADLQLGGSSELTLHAGKIVSVNLTDTEPVLAADAAGLAPLVAKLGASTIAVADSAADVDASLTGLETLGAHLSAVTVTDSAAQVGMYAADLAALAGGTSLGIVLTDATTETPVGADTAAALVPVAASLAAAAVNVSDTGLDIAADATALAELGTALGTVTLSDGDTVTAATAAAIAPIDAHLGTDVTLNVADTATHIDGHLAGLDTLQTDLRLGSVTAAGETAADVVLYGTMLAGLGGTATIDDSAAAVSAHLDALEPFCGGGGVVTQITLNDGGTPDIALSLNRLTTDAAVLGRIAGSFAYAITDTAGDLAADLGDGEASKLLTLGAKLDSIAVSDESDTLTLTAATLFATGVDDGAGSALTKLVPDTLLAVTGMSIADFASLAGLTVAPTSFAVADTNSAIQGDLEDNLESSVLLDYRSHITAIATSGAITLDYATASAAHVNDGAGSVFALMTGETLDVTAVPVTDIAAVLTTGVAPASIAVTGTAGAIASDLETASPALVQYAAKISAIADTSGTAVTLDADHALAAGVADSAASVFAKLTGGGLAVTGATVDQLDSLHGLYVIPASVAVSDDAGLIAADLELGASSRLETYAGGMLSAIASDDGIISLDDSYVAAVTAALALLPADSLDVTDVPVENIAAVAGLAGFAGMTVSDSAGDIRTDLLLGAASELAQHHLGITGVTFSSGGPISLTDAQAQTVVSAALAHLPAAGIDVTGVAVADIATITGFGAVLDSMTVSDAAAAITADLQLGGSSELTLHAGKIVSVNLTDTEPVLAADAAGLAPLVAKLGASTIAVADSAADVDASLTGLETLGAHLSAVTVTDSADQVGAYATDLATLASGTTLSIVLTDATTETPIGAGTAAALVPVAASLAAAAVNVSDTGLDIAADATALTELGTALGTVTLSDGDTVTAATAAAIAPIDAHLGHDVTLSVADTAAHIHDDLTGGNSALEAGVAAGVISAITANDAVTLALTDTQAEQVLDALGVLSDAGGLTVSDVSVQDIATIGALTALPAEGGMTVSDEASIISTDLLKGASSSLYIYHGHITSVTVTGGTVNLPYSELSGVEAAALELLPIDTLAVTDVPVDEVSTMVSYPGLYQMTVTDTAGAIQGDIEFGRGARPGNQPRRDHQHHGKQWHGDAGRQRCQRGVGCPGAAAGS